MSLLFLYFTGNQTDTHSNPEPEAETNSEQDILESKCLNLEHGKSYKSQLFFHTFSQQPNKA